MNSENMESFSKTMRKSTRNIHKISDDLINAKIAFAMSDDKIWAEGLLIFYEIFKFLEENVPETILPLLFHRKTAFESDLEFYLGKDWQKNYTQRPSVVKYLTHLQNLKENNTLLLIAYVYHLYMGLLSGGQILQKKKTLSRKLNPFTSDVDENEVLGQELTKFNMPINELKNKMRNLVDEMALNFDENLKQKLLIESRRCFELNNEIVSSIQGVNVIGLKKVFYIVLSATVLYYMYTVILKTFSNLK